MQRILCLWLCDRARRNRGENAPDAERADTARIADAWCAWLAEFSPTVGPMANLAAAPGEPPEVYLLDIGPTAALFGGERALIEQVLRACARKRIAVRAAVADTIGAAWALARFGEQVQITDRQATNDRAADELAIFEATGDGTPLLASRLAALPVEALRLSEETLARLAELGLERIEQVAKLPREALAARFDRELLWRLDQLTGDAAEPIAARAPPPRYAARRSLEYPTARRETIDALVAGLLAEAAEQLAARRRGALALTLRLELETAPAIELAVALFAPTATAAHLWQLVDLQLERLRIRSPVTAAAVAVTACAPLSSRQQTLFDEEPIRDDPRKLADLVDRLSNRLGATAVLRARSVADPQPEYAVRYRPLVGLRGGSIRGAATRTSSSASSGRRTNRKSNAEATSGASIDSALVSAGMGRLGRPLWLVSPPAVLEVMAVAPEGPPLRFRYRGENYRVVRYWGPERIETGWWRRRAVWRDYYRVETSTGHWFWLYRRRLEGDWRLHGEFV